jgi:acyl dehydratase
VAVASGLAGRIKALYDGKFVAFLGLKWDFKKPVLVGDTLRLVVFNMTLLNQHDERVQHGEFTILVRKRATGTSPPAR